MPNDPDPPRHARRQPGAALAGLAAVAGLVAAGIWGLTTDAAPGRATAARQAEVAAKGRQVMPFDLDRTTHVFADRPDGGVQTVVADDPADGAQVALIREHLRQEAARFAAGDFGDPASIHGDAMPGLAELERGFERIDVRYADLPEGARITYTTADPALVVALHTWFKAQTDDHGRHAEHTGG